MNISTDRQRELLVALRELVQHRAIQEKEFVKTRDRQLDDAVNQFESQSNELAVQFQSKRAGAENEFLTRLSEARLKFDAECGAFAQDERNVRDDLKLRHTQDQDSAKKAWRLEREHVGAVHTKQRAKFRQQWAKQEAIFEQHRAGLDHVAAGFEGVLQKRGVALPPEPQLPPPPAAESPAAALSAFMEKLETTRV